MLLHGGEKILTEKSRRRDIWQLSLGLNCRCSHSQYLKTVAHSKQLLLVEDDDAISDVVQVNLASAGFDVRRERDGMAALRAVSDQRFDLVLLDLMLPGADGWDVCRHVRAQPDYVPLIIISARTAEAHRVLGLELGADDYICPSRSQCWSCSHACVR